MSKILAVMIAGLFAAGAYAQSAEKAPVLNTPSQQKAQAKVDSKPAGQVKAQGGDTTKVSEGSGGITPNRAADSGEARRMTRDARRPSKTGGKKAVPVQGGTPQ